MSSLQSTCSFIEDNFEGIKDGGFKLSHMRSEMLRIGSYKHIPHDWFKNLIWPTQLAKAGLYYDAKKQNTMCYLSCGFVKPITFWKRGRNPLHYHNIDSPHCPFVSGSEEEEETDNIPLQTREQLEKRIAEKLAKMAENNKDEELYLLRQQVEQLNQNQRESTKDLLQMMDQVQQQLNYTSLPPQPLPTTSSLPHQQQQMTLHANQFNIIPCPAATGTSTVPNSSQIPATSPLPPPPQQSNNDKEGDSVCAGRTITPYLLERMKEEEARLCTFTRWPNGASVCPSELARAGFFFTGSSDRVQCAFCENVLRNWEHGDNPTFEHRRHFPRCRFVLGYNVGNIPIPQQQRVASFDKLRQGGYCVRSNVIEVQRTITPLQQQQPPPQQLVQQQQQQNNNVIGINSELPKHPKYLTVDSRRRSFISETWNRFSRENKQDYNILALNGFFYTQSKDNVRCFHCDGGLQNWEEEDDPATEHARWFPRCLFIRQLKGDDFVNSKAKNLPPFLNTAATATTTRASGSNNNLQLGTAVRYKIELREVKARLDTPQVRAVLDMGFNRETVVSVIRNKLEKTGEDYPSAESLLEAIFDKESEDLALELEHASSSSSLLSQEEEEDIIVIENTQTPPPPPSPVVEKKTEKTESSQSPSHRRRGKRNRGKRTFPAATSATLPPQDSTLGDESLDFETKKLRQENRQLKDQRMCKVCMDAEANIVFLPCGHLVCCANCAPALRNCAVCRSKIRGTVRTYLS